MAISTVALFGESEKGTFQRAYYCKTVAQLVDNLGHPTPDSRGIFYAIQAIMYENHLIYFRVKEEGFSHEDYLSGLGLLESKPVEISLRAIFAPGVGSCRIIDAMSEACCSYGSILITTEADLYDYLTECDNPLND